MHVIHINHHSGFRLDMHINSTVAWDRSPAEPFHNLVKSCFPQGTSLWMTIYSSQQSAVGAIIFRNLAASPSVNQLSGHHSLGSSTKVGVGVGESMTACRSAVSASLRDASKPSIAATPSAARLAAQEAGALLVSSNKSSAEFPILVRTFDP